MSGVVAWLLGTFGATVGARVVNVASLAALAPIAYWFLENKDGQAVCVSWGQLALFALLIVAFIKVAHYSAPPAAPRWFPRQDPEQ